MKKILLSSVLGLTFACLSSGAMADDPTSAPVTCDDNRPSCSDMGFKFTEDECKGYFMLHCPWNASKVACDCPFEYKEGASKGDIDSPWCKRIGVTYYRDSCGGVSQEDCGNGDLSGDLVCTDTRGVEYYAFCLTPKACEVGDVLYASSDGTKKCFAGVAERLETNSNIYEAIGVVFDTSEGNGLGLAIALDENRGTISDTNFGRCDIGGIPSWLTEGRHQSGRFKGVPFYSHCECNSTLTDCSGTDKQTGWVKDLYFSGLSNRYPSGAELQRAQLRTQQVMTDFGNGCQKPAIGGYSAAGNILLTTAENGKFKLGARSVNLTTAKLETLFPAVAYCAEYKTIGTTKANTASTGVMPNCVGENDIVSLSGWVLPAPGDWKVLERNIEAVNKTLVAYKKHNPESTAVKVAAVDIEYDPVSTYGYRSDRKYWTAYLGVDKRGKAKWMNLNGFTQLRQPDGPIIMDFENGAVGPVRSTEPGVRARCMIRYSDSYTETE